jgi:hypothetical protein
MLLLMRRRAVDMSSGGPGEDRELETEAELARKQVPKYRAASISVSYLH